MKSKKITSYTLKLSDIELTALASIVHDGTWELSDMPYAHWRAKKGALSIVAYNSGKVTFQGKNTHDFIIFTLEPKVTLKPKLGYEVVADNDLKKEEELPLPHAGIDESGKGDFFGPLVIAAVFVDKRMELDLLKCGVKDSKLIKNDIKITPIANKIRQIVEGKFSVVQIGPDAYNRLYAKIGNLNKLLAWGHARVLENVLEKVPECNTALSDKFGNESLINNALLEKGKKIKMYQRTKGESDIAVAAASILARDEFVRGIKKLGDDLGIVLPKGASVKVEDCVREIAYDYGIDKLATLGKMHFKTVKKVLG